MGTDFCFLQFDGGTIGKFKKICCYRGGDSKVVASLAHWILFDKRMGSQFYAALFVGLSETGLEQGAVGCIPSPSRKGILS